MHAESGQPQRASGRVPAGAAGGAPLGTHSGDADPALAWPGACADADVDGGIEVADTAEDAPMHDDNGGFGGADIGGAADDWGPPRTSGGGDSAAFGSVVGDAVEERGVPAAGDQVRLRRQPRNAACVS